MARPQRHDASAHHFLLLLPGLLLLLLPSATAASFSTLCGYKPPRDLPNTYQISNDASPALPLITAGHFSGGRDLRFAHDRPYTRAVTFYPREGLARATSDPAHGESDSGLPHSVSFDLDGYYNDSTSFTVELCMVGSGSYAREDGSDVVLLSDVVLRLHLPQPSNLSRPFVTGSVEGADFDSIALLAYAEFHYAYMLSWAVSGSCPPPPVPVRAGYYSCHRFRELLRSSYSLEYGPNEHDGASSSSFPLRLRHGTMYINQMRCRLGGAVRAYMVFYANQSVASPASNYTALRRRTFMIGDEALVADGFWDPSRNQLCLRACRVASSGKSGADLQVRECGIRVRLWFPAVWSIRDRSIVAGRICNTSGNSSAGNTAGVISVSRTGGYRGNLSSISYSYTRVEEAKKHYDSIPALSKERKGRFLGDAMMADAAFSLHGAAAEANKQRLLNVSYSLEYRVVVVFVNASLSADISPPEMPPRLQHVSAEGVYDIKTGSLCLVACQETTNGSSDCDVLVTFQFAPVNSVEGERGIGTIKSLRKPGDPLFFEAMDFISYGMTVRQIGESISRMDMESIMLVVSMTLSCVFTALQLRHVNKHPEALPATSVTMLVVLALGYVIPLVLNLEDMYADTRRRYILQLTTAGSLDLNEFMLRASTILALLRLLHLALSRRSTDQAGSKHEASSPADAERSTLWICLPLYVLGAVVVWIVHMSDGHHHHSPRASAFSVSASPSGPALADDLAAYAGLILDGFLLPQVISNALSGSRVRALSPWFYAGGTVIRAAPHVYDVFRKYNYVLPGWKPTTYVYASPRDDLFGVAWDVAIPCGATLLAALLFLQQWLGGAFLCCLKSRRSGSSEYEMVSTTTIST
ncbi:unnamed protein product [Urochloa decumbens]|uniref:RING-type E3 ubiquitin transferase n=1 Tax=Urochloa decumbens TaxID=240449 RepID=A0ABC9G746_9POAL